MSNGFRLFWMHSDTLFPAQCAEWRFKTFWTRFSSDRGGTLQCLPLCQQAVLGGLDEVRLADAIVHTRRSGSRSLASLRASRAGIEDPRGKGLRPGTLVRVLVARLTGTKHAPIRAGAGDVPRSADLAPLCTSIEGGAESVFRHYFDT